MANTTKILDISVVATVGQDTFPIGADIDTTKFKVEVNKIDVSYSISGTDFVLDVPALLDDDVRHFQQTLVPVSGTDTEKIEKLQDAITEIVLQDTASVETAIINILAPIWEMGQPYKKDTLFRHNGLLYAFLDDHTSDGVFLNDTAHHVLLSTQGIQGVQGVQGPQGGAGNDGANGADLTSYPTTDVNTNTVGIINGLSIKTLIDNSIITAKIASDDYADGLDNNTNLRVDNLQTVSDQEVLKNVKRDEDLTLVINKVASIVNVEGIQDITNGQAVALRLEGSTNGGPSDHGDALILDSDTRETQTLLITIKRKTDTEERLARVQLDALYFGGAWHVSRERTSRTYGEPDGIVFSWDILSPTTIQLKYTADTMAGTNHVGEMIYSSEVSPLNI